MFSCLLCLCLVFSVGFLSVDKAYASSLPYDKSNAVYITWPAAPYVVAYDTYGAEVLSHQGGYNTSKVWLNINNHTNATDLYNVESLTIGPSPAKGGQEGMLDFPLYTSVYDYFLVGTFWGSDYYTASRMSFFPDDIRLGFADKMTGEAYDYVSLSNLSVKPFESNNTYGFAFAGKIPSDDVSSIIYAINFLDEDGGTVGTSAAVRFYLVAVNRLLVGSAGSGGSGGSGGSVDLGGITDGLGDMVINQESTNNTLIQIEETINSQYQIDDSSELDISGSVNQVDEIFASLNIAPTIGERFSSLFSSDERVRNEPIITLPGFSINVQGVDYTVWEAQSFNFNQLDVWFPDTMPFIKNILATVYTICFLNFILGYVDRFIGLMPLPYAFSSPVKASGKSGSGKNMDLNL